MPSLRVKGDRPEMGFVPLGHRDSPSMHLPGAKIPIHSYQAWDPALRERWGSFCHPCPCVALKRELAVHQSLLPDLGVLPTQERVRPLLVWCPCGP